MTNKVGGLVLVFGFLVHAACGSGGSAASLPDAYATADVQILPDIPAPPDIPIGPDTPAAPDADLPRDIPTVNLGADGVTSIDAVAPLDTAPPFDAAPDTAVARDTAGDLAIVPDAQRPVDTATPADTGTPPDDHCPAPPADLPQLTVEEYGRFHVVRNFPGDGLRSRDVTVFLPADYDAHPTARYAVLYMHDGQNLFDAAQAAFGVEWQVDEAVDEAVAAAAIPPIIVVGVNNTDDRLDEYRSGADPTVDDGSLAADYRRLLAERVKPWVDAHYRTRCGRANTALAGSSMGGVASLAHALAYPDVWGRVACLSSAFWYGDGEFLTYFAAVTPAQVPERAWLDAGTSEGNWTSAAAFVDDTRAVRDRLRAHGLAVGDRLGYQEAVGAVHNEAAWALRMPTIVRFLFGAQTFRALPETGLALVLFDDALRPGETTSCVVQGTLSGGIAQTWPNDEAALASDDDAVARVSATDGTVTAVAAGTTHLRAQHGGFPAEAAVQVATGTRVRLRVTVPADTPAGATVYVSGDVPELGGWAPGAVPLQPASGVWERDVLLETGTPFEYKYTLGTWDTVERDAEGNDVANRTGTADRDRVLEDTVERWSASK